MWRNLFIYCQDKGGLLEKLTDNNLFRWLADRGDKIYFIELVLDNDEPTILVTTKVKEYMKVFYDNDNDYVIGSGTLNTSEDLAEFIQSCIEDKNIIISFEEYQKNINKGLTTPLTYDIIISELRKRC